MKVVSLIKKYGEKTKVNDDFVYGYIDDTKRVLKNKRKIKGFNSLSFKNVFLLPCSIGLSSVVEIDKVKHRIFELKEIGGEYYELLLYKDDIVNDIQIFSMDMSRNVDNRPIKEDLLLETKARIGTVNKESLQEQFAYHSGKMPTHFFVILDVDLDKNKAELITWKNRNFEVLSIEDVQEYGSYLYIEAIEVLL